MFNLYREEIQKNWSNSYRNHINRNIGLIKIEEQEKIRTTPITIFGVGGLGGSIAEQLVRSGCEQIVICDNDKFEETNLNRQLCTREDLEKNKVDIISKYLRKINPEIKVQTYCNVSEENISIILNDSSIAVLTLDDPITSILISRECLKKNIPMLESWGIPYLWAWWFTSESINYETCYGFSTLEMKIDEIRNSNKFLLEIKKALLDKLLQFPKIHETYNREPGVVKRIISGELPLVSLAPVVRITASYLTFEIIYAGILKEKKKILAPNVVGYDYLRMKPIEFILK